ncbi:hypothetical protein RAHE111665_01175 [Rariglobus hedericola]
MASEGGAWWKGEPDWWRVTGHEKIDRREKTEEERVVGAYPELVYPWREQRWNFLPKEKQTSIRQLDREYAEMIENLPPGPWLAEEKEMYNRLLAEKRRDVEALLSKDELAEYDFREDGQSLDREIGKYSPNEAELRAVYRAQRERERVKKELLARYPGEAFSDPFASPLSRNPKAVAEENAVEETYKNQLKEIFGAERLERGDREADKSFRSIVTVVDKFKLDRTQAEVIYAVLNQADAELKAPVTRAVSQEEYEIRKAALRLDVIEEIKGRLPANAVDLLLEQLTWEHYWLKEP